MVDMSLLKPKEPRYRFALYGRAASGKTCILAALAMQRRANVRGFTCTPVINPPGIKRPAGDPATWNTEKPGAAYYLGRIWLDQAINRLSHGDLPPPNPNRAAPLKYLFHFTEPEGRSFQVELTDYSGELIDAEISGDEMAQKLQAHMREMDGIMVLAEIAREGTPDHNELAVELHRLEQAFVTMRSSGLCSADTDTPVALLFNKWDRFSEIDHEHPGREEQLLTEFLSRNPPPPHQGLAQVLNNSVSPGNFKAFPISAFGAARIVCDEKSCLEKPARINPLPAFNLETPFIWSAIRREENEVALFTRMAEKRSSLCLWKCRTMLPPWRLLKRGRVLAARLPSTRAGELKKPLRRLSLYSLGQTLVLVVIIMLTAYSTEAMFDGLQFRAVVSYDSNPASTAKDLSRAEGWLEAYYRSPGWRHLFARFAIIDRGEALTRLRHLRDRREAMFWNPVNTAKGNTLKARLAGRYLSRFGENGHHVEEAFAIITGIEIERGLEKNRAALARAGTALEAMTNGDNLNRDAIKALEYTVDNLPIPNQVDKDIIDQQQWLLRRLAEEKINLARRDGEAKTTVFREIYEQLIKQRQYRDAARLINASSLPPGKIKPFHDDFATKISRWIKAGTIKDINSRQWHRARRQLSLITDDRDILGMISPATLKKIRALTAVIDRAEDRYLYRQLLKFRDGERTDAYLESAPLKQMSREVKRFKVYLDRSNSRLGIKTSIATINWGESCGNTEVIVRVDGDEVLDRKKIRARAAERSAQVGTFPLSIKPSGRLKLEVETICHGFWSSNRSGFGVWTGKAVKLDGLSLTLSGKGEARTVVNFRATGLPAEPELPPWRQ